MRHPSSHIFDFTPDTLRCWATTRGLPPFRAAQILEWVYQKGIADPAMMSNLSKRDRELLADPSDGITFLSGETISHQKASDGTQKLLVQWEEYGDRGSGESQGAESLSSPDTRNPKPETRLSLLVSDSTRQTECVMIPAGGTGGTSASRDDADDDNDRSDANPIPTRERRTACISSQVGCPVGCKFCASGIGGLDGNLSAGRIVEQVWRLRSVLPPLGGPPLRGVSSNLSSPCATDGEPMPEPPRSGGPPVLARISNVVFMGMGEPLSNFSAVTHAIRTLNAPWGMNIGARRITLSTVGLPKAIERLAEEFDIPVTLALSLHAPNDDIRRQLIPWAEYTTIPELLAACQKWFAKTGREITLEYILLGGVNDQPAHARQLAEVARSLRANVNLIRYNEVKGMPFVRPDDGDVLAFQNVLRDKGVNTHIRASRGRDIAAACGQLRHEGKKESAVVSGQ